MAKRKRGCGCFGIGALVVLLIVCGLVAGGAIYFVQSPRVLDQIVGKETGAKSGLRVVEYSSIFKGELRVEVPNELWHREVEALFPISETFADFVKLDLRNPRFVNDPQDNWLRMELDVVANVMNASNESFPGHAVLRTQLKLGPEGRSVLLDKAELIDFGFTGEAGRLVQALQGVLKEAFAEELQDFPVFEIPEGESWIQKQGSSFLRDVRIQNHKVVVVIGG